MMLIMMIMMTMVNNALQNDIKVIAESGRDLRCNVLRVHRIGFIAKYRTRRRRRQRQPPCSHVRPIEIRTA